MRSKNFIIPLICLLFAFALEMPLSSSSMSVQVAKGDISVVEQKEITKICASDESILDCDHFDVKEGQTVKIVQPSADSTLIIRVNSGLASRIKSRLVANGRVYIYNPNGIFIDKEAKVEKGSFYFVGSELEMQALESENGVAMTSGDVVNHGTIDSIGTVHLIGRHVVNSGTIKAQEQVKITHTNAKDQLSILHTGLIESKDVFIEARDGVCEIYGKIDAKNAVENQYGGNICVLGQQVRLIGAYIDASGTFSGGQVNLGGPLEGKGDLFKATRTSIDNATVIDASAIEYGAGGQVVVWSEELTSFQGEIFARGGRQYGAGGRVETSSSNHLGVFSGKVNVDAACGEPGEWLLDPSNIVISDAEDASDNLDLVTEYPAKSGSQVTISVKAINNFSGGKLQIAASNRITIDANIENISSTLDLTFRAGSQIRLKNEEVNVPNGKVAFIVDNETSGQVICSKDFKGITAHELLVVAPKGQDNGFQVETNSLVLNPTYSNRAEPKFVFNTDVVAKNNANHQLYLKRSKNAVGSVAFNGSLDNFDFVNAETHLKVAEKTKVGHMVCRGATTVELLGGGEVRELIELENFRGITLGGHKDSYLKINGDLNTTSSVTKFCGTVETSGSIESNDVKLLGDTHLLTSNNPLVIHQNVSQENAIANLKLETQSAAITIEGSTYVNDLEIDSEVAPSLCGEVCVFNFNTNSPSISFSHDLIVSGQIRCENLTTSGENKKVAFARGGVFKGKTTFDHSGTTTLGDHQNATFSFEDMLNTHKSVTYSQGILYVDGPVEMSDLNLLGDTSIECAQYACNISGTLLEQDCDAHLHINTKNDQITIGKYVEINGLSLNTSHPLKLEVPVNVTTFTTTSPSVEFTHHLIVDDSLSSNNLLTSGENSQVTIYGGAQINGAALFENGAGLTLGREENSQFVVNNRFSCPNTLAKIQGQFDIMGQVAFHDIELQDHTLIKTHGHQLNVEKSVLQNDREANFSVISEAGEISLGQEVIVNELSLESTSPVYVAANLEAVNLKSTSPLITFANDTLVHEKIQTNSIASVGADKKLQLMKGGSVQGDAKLSNGGVFIMGGSEEDLLELQGPLDRSNGQTIAQGTIRSVNGSLDFEEVILSGRLNVLSVSNDGQGQTISFHSEVNGAYPLTVNAANSTIVVDRQIGAQSPLRGLTFYAKECITKSDITLDKGAGEFYTHMTLANNVKIEDLGKEGLYLYGNVDGDFDLNLVSSQLVVLKKDIGSVSPLNAVNISARRIDVWASIAANSGSINFDGDVELCENVRLVNCGSTGITFNGRVDGDYYAELKVNDQNGKISFNDDVGQFQPLKHLVLATQTPVVFNRKVSVEHFETTAPTSTFYSDTLIVGQINAHNVVFDGARQNVNLMGGGHISGNATFKNKGDLNLGADDQVELTVQGIISRVDGPTYARGQINTEGSIVDFSALQAVGALKMVSQNTHGTSFNFNSTLDGTQNITIVSENGSVNFYDCVGGQHALSALNVVAPQISMQRQISVLDGHLNFDGNLELLNHSSIRNISGSAVTITGDVNGEWDLNVEMNAQDSKLVIAGNIGQLRPINHLNLEIPTRVDFNQDVSVYNLKTSSPLINFNQNAEIKQHLQACNVIMSASSGQFTLLGSGSLEGDLELNNTLGSTILGDSKFSTLSTEGQLRIFTENTFAQGLLESQSSKVSFNRLHLSGPLKVSTVAHNGSGEEITFNEAVLGSHSLEVDGGTARVTFAQNVGDTTPVDALSVNGSSIALGGDINVGEGASIFNGDVILKNNIKIQDQGNSVISFAGQIDGPYDLELVNQNEAGKLFFGQAVGSERAINVLSMSTQNAVEFPKNVHVNTLKTSSPTIAFGDEATVENEVRAHHLVTKGKYRSVRFLGSGHFSGMTTFSNSGSLVLGSRDDSEFNFSGPLAVEECVLITQGQINTQGSVSLRELSLKGNTAFNAPGHEFKVRGVVEEVTPGSDLAIEVGSGEITFGEAVTAHNLKFNSSLPVQFHNPVNVYNLETKAPHVLFANHVTINGEISAQDITAVGSEYKVKLLGGGSVYGNAVLKNGNGIVFGSNDQAILTFHGPVDTTASLLEARGTIETVDKTIDIGNLSVVGNTTIRSTSKDSAGKNIYFLGVIEGPKQLRANAGKAKISFENHIGSQTALESLQATGSTIEVDGDINSLDGNVVFAGDVIFTNTSNLTAHGNANIIFQGTVNVDGNAKGPVDLILDATGKIEFQKDVGDTKAFNEVLVTRAGELVCRSPLKSNILTQSKESSLAKVEEKASQKEEATVEATKESISKSETQEDVHES